jgi:beta-glucosidase
MRLFCAALFAASAALGQTGPVYKNPDIAIEKRIADLVSRMTLEEKVSQMMNESAAIPRLDIPAYNWWNECLHGVARAGRATVFPEPIGLAATWDPALLFRMATAVSTEARAKHNEFVRKGKRGIYQGLTFWTPNINLVRDPRWGRGMETYGEDPYLVGRMAVQFIKGLQGDDPAYLKVVATAKHFAVHSGPEALRHSFDARVEDADLRASYLPHFDAAIREGGAYSVMCAYNRVDGEPACASPRLLADILRKEWGFPGYVVSDCGAVGDIFQGHKVAASMAEAAARAVRAGTDLDCGSEYRALLPAVQQRLIAESEIDTAVRRLVTARFRLGMFDPPEKVAYARIPYTEVDSAAHRALALETARKSIVLLKNQDGVLPLRKSIRTLAVIGPNADSVDVLLGNYNGEPTEPVTPLEGIRRKLGKRTEVIYAHGSDLAANLPAMQTVPASALFTTSDAAHRSGLNGEYYNSASFNGRIYRAPGRPGAPVDPTLKPVFTRIDPQIDFKWWDGAPRPDMDDDNFGVRWTGYLSPPVSGAYQIGGVGMNAFEIFLDDKEIVRSNNTHERNYAYETVNLQTGRLYPIRVEFHEVINDADMRLVWSVPGQDPEPAALDAARKAEAVVMFLGLSPRLEGEEMKVPVAGFQSGDRVQLSLPLAQEQLLQQISALGKPVVLVLLNGSALAVNWARDHVPAIVEAWYPGQAGGSAIADVLFGDYNPGGRLPITFYQSADQLPAFDDYSMKGRTYRYFQGEPLYPFGYGLSYTRFTYQRLLVPQQSPPNREVKVAVEVANAGKLAGEEVVQLYVRRAGVRSLEGFERIGLRPGEKRTVQFTVKAAQPGIVEISIGGKQPGSRGPADAATTQVLTATMNIAQ